MIKMYVDITTYEDLEENASDVVICINRPYVAHKMDVWANYYGYHNLDSCPKLSTDILHQNNKVIRNISQVHCSSKQTIRRNQLCEKV